MTQNPNNNKPKMMVENISCIVPEDSNSGGLFVGNVYGAQNPAILKQYGIRAVLTSSIQTDINYNFQDIPFHLKIQAHDKQNYNLRQHINSCIHFIQQARKITNVYVHCYAGVSRSIAIVCSYIMWKFKWNYQTTIAFVKAKRVVAKPNDGFVKQLLEIQEILLETSYHKPEVKKVAQYKNTKLQQQNKINNSNLSYGQVQENIRNNLKSMNGKQQKPNTTGMTYLNQAINGLHINQYQNNIANQFNPIKSLRQNSNYSQNARYQTQNANFLTGRDQSIVNPYFKNEHHMVPKQFNQNIIQTKNPPKIHQLSTKPTSRQGNSKMSLNQTSKVSLNQLNSAYVVNKINKTQNSNYYDNSINMSTTGANGNQNIYNNKNTNLQKPNSLSNNYGNYQIHSRQIANNLQHTTNRSNAYKQQNQQRIILGGNKKSAYNHNQIPIPKVSQRKQINNNKSYQNKEINNQKYVNNNVYSANIHQKNAFNFTSPEKYDTSTKYSVNNLYSPKSENVYNQKYDFRSSAPSQGFFKKEAYNTGVQTQKSTSRCLVRPKDLPGYKNYK